MIGLSYLLFFLLYLAVAVLVVWLAVMKAKKRGISGWKWGIPAALVMYLLVFWDQIPTFVLHKYYCSKEAGFTVYKTLSEWESENQDVIDLLDINLEPAPESKNSIIEYWTTQRFYTSVNRNEERAHAISVENKKFVDAENQETIAESVNYWRGNSGATMVMGRGIENIRRYISLGFGNRQCGSEGESPSDLMDEFRYSFQQLGERNE